MTDEPRLSLPWHSQLSPQETRVVELYLDGWSPKEIAGHLFISVKTVGVHLFSIRQKMKPHGLRFIRQVTTAEKITPERTPMQNTQGQSVGA